MGAERKKRAGEWSWGHCSPQMRVEPFQAPELMVHVEATVATLFPLPSPSEQRVVRIRAGTFRSSSPEPMPIQSFSKSSGWRHLYRLCHGTCYFEGGTWRATRPMPGYFGTPAGPKLPVLTCGKFVRS